MNVKADYNSLMNLLSSHVQTETAAGMGDTYLETCSSQ